MMTKVTTASTSSGSVCLAQARDTWMLVRAIRKDSAHTTAAYRRDLKALGVLLAQELGRDPHSDDPLQVLTVEDLTVSNLRAAFSAFAANHEKASIARAQSTWRGLCGFCVSEGWLPGDPMSGVPKVAAPKRQPKPLRGELDTANVLLRFLLEEGRGGRDPWPERDLAVVATLLLAGLRSQELRDLERGDIFGRRGERRLRVLGKGDKERAVPLEPALELVLQTYEESRRRRFPSWKPALSDPLFVDGKNTALSASQLRYLVSTSLREAGLGSTAQRGALVHGLRHTFATLLVENGASATEVMVLLGHASLATSQGYIKASAREVRQTAAANPLYGTLGQRTR